MLIDREVRTLVDGANERATQVLTENRDKLDALANALLEREILDADGNRHRPPRRETSSPERSVGAAARCAGGPHRRPGTGTEAEEHLRWCRTGGSAGLIRLVSA